MAKKLFLLDGMGMIYRAHFALISRPIFSSKGVNTSALYGFTQSLLQILREQEPTHIAVAMDSGAPTHRLADFKDYKAQRQETPEDIEIAIPNVYRMLEAFNIPALTCEGYEADDIVATLVKKAEQEGFQCYMATLDKDFGQLVTANTFLYKLSRMGDAVEILGVPEVLKKWEIQRPEQVADVMALWGDTSDNIPGVPGFGEKTAKKLIGQYGSLENLLEHTAELKGKMKENLEKNREQAVLSKKLATLIKNAPCAVDFDSLRVRKPDEEKLKALLNEFEFNSIGRRIFGDSFRVVRGGQTTAREDAFTLSDGQETAHPKGGTSNEQETGDLFAAVAAEEPSEPVQPKPEGMISITAVPHDYKVAGSAEERKQLLKELSKAPVFGVHAIASSLDPKQARLLGMAFSLKQTSASYVPVGSGEVGKILEEFRPVLESSQNEKVGHNLKYHLGVLRWNSVAARGKVFDTMIAHALIEPDMRHTLAYLAEVYLGYSVIPMSQLIGEKDPISLADVPVEKMAELACESAELTWTLRPILESELKRKRQETVFYKIEAPLVTVLADMEVEGIRVDSAALGEFGAQLAKEIDQLEKTICGMAGREFNINSGRQLGEVLFEVMKICEKPKKTKTGQYATDEQTLLTLAPEHEIVQKLMEYRSLTKLKSTYADTLPEAIWPKTGRIHTTFNQVMTSTGRLSSQDPNLQNIPIRRERGQEIRRAFVPRDKDHLLLSVDYSQIELRIIAALSREPGLLDAFKNGTDVHTATAARVFGVSLEQVDSEMRRKAKMVNYGIAYGISAFGLAQRLAIPRREAMAIIEQYFAKFPGIRQYMNDTIALAREKGYVETVTGRRRYMRDINSANAATRGGAERNAINAPIQGTAADMIKIAMIEIQRELQRKNFRTRMLLQVHDELVFDLYKPEEKEILALVEEKMKSAIALDVPIEVEMGTGQNWLEAH